MCNIRKYVIATNVYYTVHKRRHVIKRSFVLNSVRFVFLSSFLRIKYSLRQLREALERHEEYDGFSTCWRFLFCFCFWSQIRTPIPRFLTIVFPLKLFQTKQVYADSFSVRTTPHPHHSPPPRYLSLAPFSVTLIIN